MKKTPLPEPVKQAQARPPERKSSARSAGSARFTAAGAGDGFGSREYWRAANAHAAKRLGEELAKNIELTQQRDHEAARAKAAIRQWTKTDRARAEAERKLAICLRALDLLRRDSKSPDFVKVYCALIEGELAALGGGGAERQGEETCEQSRAASPNA